MPTDFLSEEVIALRDWFQDAMAETAVWGQHDCWVVALCRGPRRLYVVLEQQGKEGLLPACQAADDFARTHFPGLFL